MTSLDIIESFNQRNAYFQQESTWSEDISLNKRCAEILLNGLERNNPPVRILDYGAGLGALSKLLVEQGFTVDIAEISSKMLESCSHIATQCILIPRDSINETYDRIILRQVLQYIEYDKWDDFILTLLSNLSAEGGLLFSQIVPHCRIDYDYWQRLTRTRRKQRLSFPTENEFLQLCENLNIPIISISVSYTKQSLHAWIYEAPLEIQYEIRKQFEETTSAIRALWKIKHEENGDISWINRWIHVMIAPPKSK